MYLLYHDKDNAIITVKKPVRQCRIWIMIIQEK